ncbi:MAG TPA: hypothetical protein VK668_04500 [Mucilaginibacter sp.]|nr:hypothetical protein [Mucilaginibacter sp.]
MIYIRKRRHAVRLPHYQIAEVKPLGQNHEIEAYLRTSGIWLQAQNKLKEVYYYVQDESNRRKNFFAAGWLNELGHWQVAAPNFTGCLCRPALTIFPGEKDEAWLFETCFDYLRHPELLNTKAHIIILNDPGLLAAGLAKAKEFHQTRTFFNNPLPAP